MWKEAVRFWERRRVPYNVVLVLIALSWGILTWPHFRPALALVPMLQLSVLAVIANVLYSAAYLSEIPIQLSLLSESRRRWRRVVWYAGTLFAVLLTNYWIADEIYPFVNAV